LPTTPSASWHKPKSLDRNDEQIEQYLQGHTYYLAVACGILIENLSLIWLAFRGILHYFLDTAFDNNMLYDKKIYSRDLIWRNNNPKCHKVSFRSRDPRPAGKLERIVSMFCHSFV
jgi:hypothetical protein